MNMLYITTSGDQRFELLELNLLPDQSHVPEDVRNLAQGFYFILEFSYTTELEYPHRSLHSIDKKIECKFYVELSQLDSEAEDSLPCKLCANLSGKEIPIDVQNTMTDIIVDETKSIACTTPNPRYKVEPILVQIEIVNVISMETSFFRSGMVILRVGKGSLKGEQCMICLEEFSGGEVGLMPCSHVYHLKCIDKWLDNSADCPTCRFTLQPPPT